MADYNITIIAEHSGTYTADSIEEAEKIAQDEACEAYNRLKGRYRVEIERVEMKTTSN